MSKKLQIVIDIQNDFISNTDDMIPNIIARIKAHDWHVISVHDTHFDESNPHMMPENGKSYFDSLESEQQSKHCIKLTKGWEYVPEVLETLQEKNKRGKCMFHTIDKYTFGYTGWKDQIEFYEPDEIEIFGLYTDRDVISNALIIRALYPNIPITIVEKCCVGTTPEKHLAAIEVAKSCQIKVI